MDGWICPRCGYRQLTANQITARIGLRPIKGMSGPRLWYGD